MVEQKITVGDFYSTSNSGKLEVIEYNSWTNIKVRFTDGTEVIARSSNILKGTVKNPNHPIVCGIGYLGQGVYSKRTHTILYQKWNSMLTRCYGPKRNEYTTYEECTVAKRWHNFQNFCADVTQMVGYDKLSERWQLDKDIIYRNNCKYSRKTCCLIPQEINKLLEKADAIRGDLPVGVTYSSKDGNPYRAVCCSKNKKVALGNHPTVKAAFLAYKNFKEKEIKRVANLYKDEIDPRAYKALINYEVTIDD